MPTLHVCTACDTPVPQGAAYCPSCGAATPTGMSRETGEILPPLQLEFEEEEFRARLQATLADVYELRELIGQGGFAAVYSAWDVRLEREVAVKVIRPDLFPSPALIGRFQREAQAVAKLRHPNIVPIYSVGEGEGLAYFVMPLIRGLGLRAILDNDEEIAIPEVRRILMEAGQALQAAHREGIVHRDIKPDNIMLEGDERRVLIMDFGIAKAVGPGEAGGFTSTGVIIGTPQYLSPEQASGSASIDHRADIYSLGVIGYQLLTRRLPFEGVTSQELIVQHIATPPPSLTALRPDVATPFADAVMRCLEKDPERRWNAAADLVSALETAPTEARVPGADVPTASDHAITDIAKAVEAGECLLFLGLRIPTDPEDDPSRTAERLLSEQLAEWLTYGTGGDRLPQVAQQLEMERGRAEMLEHLLEAVRNPKAWPRDLVRRIARVPFPVIVTTAYDTLLEDELARAGRTVRRVVDCRRVPDDVPDQDLLVRLFGSLDEQESVVVTEDDLWDFFSNFHAIADVLKSLFATRTIVFVGYDPGDDTFRHLYSEVGRFRAARAGGCYLVSSIVATPAVRWMERKGLQVVELDPGEFLARLEAQLEQRRGRPSAPRKREDLPLPSRPYKFLNYFEEADERIFFGRKAEIRKLASKIHAYPLILLYAPSGSGKTSLIHAGLIPQLKRDGYVPIYARVYDDPEGEIRKAVVDITVSAGRGIGDEVPLHDFLPQVAGRAGKPLVIFLDQFEEIFIRYDEEFRQHFAGALQKCIAASAGRVRFVLALREDFLARLSEFREQIPSIFHNEFRLDPLSDENARVAIGEPPRLFGLDVEPKLVDRLIADLSAEGIDPPQLQIVCDTLHDALEPDEKTLSLKSYLKLGETRKILGKYLERVLLELPAQERKLTREVLKNLVTSEETKIVSSVDDIGRLVGDTSDAVSAILTELSNRRLVRRVPREEGFWYELTHEYLVEEIRSWLSDKERELKKVRELLEQALRNHQHLGVLMPPTQIRLVRTHEADLNMSKEEIQLLKESEQAQRTKQKVVALVGTAAALLLIVSLVFWRFQYLNSHVFIEAEDREFIEQTFADRTVTHRFEGIRLHVGSPARMWLDALLGFPKPVRQAEFDLDELDPAFRDSVKVGLVFDRGTSVEDELLTRLEPQDQITFLVATGRAEEVLPALSDLYSDRSVARRALDSLSQFLGHSNVTDSRFVSAALANAFRPSGSDMIFIGGFGMDFEVRSIVPVLSNLPPDSVRAMLPRLLENRRTLGDGLALVGTFGGSELAQAASRFMDDADQQIRTKALSVISQIGDCSYLSQVRRGLEDRQAQWDLELLLPYLVRCGDASDLPRVERLAGQSASLPWAAAAGPRTLYRLGGSGAVPHIRRLLRATRTSAFALQGLRGIPDPAVLPVIRDALSAPDPSAAATAASLLAERGDATALEVAAGIAADNAQGSEARRIAVSAFQWFQGPNVTRFLGQLLDADIAWDLRSEVHRVLAWHDDAAAWELLVRGFSDPNSDVSDEAFKSVATLDPKLVLPFLQGSLDDAAPAERVYIAYAIQFLGGGDYSNDLRSFVEDSVYVTDDYDAVIHAVVGLRDAYLDLPATAPLSALGSPSRDVRHAAIMALMEHGDRQPVDDSLEAVISREEGHLRTAALMARWAIALARRTEARFQQASALLRQGRAVEAELLRAQTFDFGYRSALARRLTGIYENSSPRGLQESQLYLGAATSLRRGEYDWALNRLQTLVRFNPKLAKALRDDPNFEELRPLYAFRVISGLEKPRLAEDIELPVPARPGSNESPDQQ